MYKVVFFCLLFVSKISLSQVLYIIVKDKPVKLLVKDGSKWQIEKPSKLLEYYPFYINENGDFFDDNQVKIGWYEGNDFYTSEGGYVTYNQGVPNNHTFKHKELIYTDSISIFHLCNGNKVWIHPKKNNYYEIMAIDHINNGKKKVMFNFKTENLEKNKVTITAIYVLIKNLISDKFICGFGDHDDRDMLSLDTKVKMKQSNDGLEKQFDESNNSNIMSSDYTNKILKSMNLPKVEVQHMVDYSDPINRLYFADHFNSKEDILIKMKEDIWMKIKEEEEIKQKEEKEKKEKKFEEGLHNLSNETLSLKEIEFVGKWKFSSKLIYVDEVDNYGNPERGVYRVEEEFIVSNDRTYLYNKKVYKIQKVLTYLGNQVEKWKLQENNNYNEKGYWQLNDNKFVGYIIEENGKKVRRIDNSVVFETLSSKKATYKAYLNNNVEYYLKGKKRDF
jgi:hypothetical protein